MHIKLGESNLTTDCSNADSSILLSLYSHKYLACKYILLNIFEIYKFVAICSANLPEISVYKIFVRKVNIFILCCCQMLVSFAKKITVTSNGTIWYTSMQFQLYLEDSILIVFVFSRVLVSFVFVAPSPI